MLGVKTLWVERMTNRTYDGDFSKLRFSSVEAYTGVGLKIKLFKNWKWVNSVGLGGYTSFNFSHNLYYRANNIGLILKTGVAVNFN